MLASQFLSVVIDEGDSGHVQQSEEPESPNSNGTSEDTNGCENTLIQNLEAVCKLPKVLLAECTISLSNSEDKQSVANRQCRFDAYVTPVPKPRLKTVALSRLLQEPRKEPEDEESPNSMQNIEDPLQGVEAVHSDEEGGGEGSGRNIYYLKARCQVCRRGFFRRCEPSRTKWQLGKDEFIPRGFQCRVCGKVYSQRSVLKKPEAVHSGYRLRCKVCGIDFTQRSSLLRQCKRIHGIASDNDIPTPLVPPDPRLAVPSKVVANTSTTKYVPGLADRRSALLSKKEDSITLAITKKTKNIGPYTVAPHTVMTITPDVIIQTDQD